MAEETENNIKRSTKEGKLKTLVWSSNHFKDRLTFREMSKEDILKYLQKDKHDKSYRWAGTYNGRQMILLKFFKWLYSSNESDSRLTFFIFFLHYRLNIFQIFQNNSAHTLCNNHHVCMVFPFLDSLFSSKHYLL